MKVRNWVSYLLVISTVFWSASLFAHHGGKNRCKKDNDEFRAKLKGKNEVPAIVSPGEGKAEVELIPGDSIEYSLEYEDTIGEVTQAHIHVAQAGVNGGVGAFLCSNLGNGPDGTPECPDPDDELEGTITADDVIGPDGQGVSAGDLSAFMQAIRNGSAYVNVHTDAFPSGELRGQLRD